MFYYDILDDNPVGLWPLDYTATSVFTDASGFDRDASSSGTLQFVEPITARGVGSVRFSNSDTITFPFVDALLLGKESRSCAIEMWVKVENDLGQITTTKGIIIDGTDIIWNLGGVNYLFGDNVLEVGVGAHVVLTYTLAAMCLYVDSVLVATTPVENPNFSALTASTIVFTGNNSNTQVNIDTMAFYNYSLATDRIIRHYMLGQAVIPAQNVSASANTIWFEFDDMHLPAPIIIDSEYQGIINNVNIRDNEIHQVYDETLDPNFFGVGTYTELIQFDDLQTGTATNARVDWEVDGDPTKVTVESSVDGISWGAVTNHGMTTNMTGPIVNEDFFVRVTIAAGATDTVVWGLSITLYRGFVYSGSDSTVTATATGGTITTGYQFSDPTRFRNREGVKLNSGAGLVVSTHTNFGTQGSVELLVKPLTSDGVIYAKGAASIARVAGNYVFSGFDRVVIDGNDITTGTAGPAALSVGWKHIIATFTTPSTGVSYIGTNTSGASPQNFQVGYFVMHSKKLTLAEAQAIYQTYVGAAPLTILDPMKTVVGEHNFPTTLQPVKLYALDWAISESGF